MLTALAGGLALGLGDKDVLKLPLMSKIPPSTPPPAPRQSDPDAKRFGDDRGKLVEAARTHLRSLGSPAILPDALDLERMGNEMEGVLLLLPGVDAGAREGLIATYSEIGTIYNRWRALEAKLKQLKPEVRVILEEVGISIEPGFIPFLRAYFHQLESAFAPLVVGIKEQGLASVVDPKSGKRQDVFIHHLEKTLALMQAGWGDFSEPWEGILEEIGQVPPPRLTSLSPTYAALNIHYYKTLANFIIDFYFLGTNQAEMKLRRHLAKRGLEQEWIFDGLKKHKKDLGPQFTMGDVHEEVHLLTERIMNVEIGRSIQGLYQNPLNPMRAKDIHFLREKLLAFTKYHLHAQGEVMAGTNGYLDLVTLKEGSGRAAGRLVDRCRPAIALKILLKAFRSGFLFLEKSVKPKNYLLIERQE